MLSARLVSTKEIERFFSIKRNKKDVLLFREIERLFSFISHKKVYDKLIS